MSCYNYIILVPCALKIVLYNSMNISLVVKVGEGDKERGEKREVRYC